MYSVGFSLLSLSNEYQNSEGRHPEAPLFGRRNAISETFKERYTLRNLHMQQNFGKHRLPTFTNNQFIP